MILVDKQPVFGPTLMTRGCLGALCLAASRPMKFRVLRHIKKLPHCCAALLRRPDVQHIDAIES